MPLQDWKNRYSGTSYWRFAVSPLTVEQSYPADFERNKLGVCSDIRLTYHLTRKHALSLEVGFIGTSASVYQFRPVATTMDHHTRHGIGEAPEFTDSVLAVYEWDFEAIPVGLSYEFYPRSTGGKLSPFVGIGGSFFFSRVRYKRDAAYEPDPYPGLHLGLNEEPMTPPNKRDDRVGNGYGLHMYAGAQYRLTQRLLALFRLRGRYADGMAFTDEEHDVKVEFTGVDLTLGLGWRF